MPLRVLSVLFLVAVVASGCQSTHCASCDNAQAAVERFAQANPEVTRLTLHCANPGGGAMACASTSADKRGKPSDAEDLRAMQSGQPVVLDESGALDVTVPILTKDGRHTAAAGVTLRPSGMTRDQAIDKARTIAKGLEAELAKAGDCSCSCCAPK